MIIKKDDYFIYSVISVSFPTAHILYEIYLCVISPLLWGKSLEEIPSICEIYIKEAGDPRELIN